jgi:hypothetical protein
MNTSRKHADATARRPETLPDTRRTRATLFPRLFPLAAGLLLTALSAGAAAQQSQATRKAEGGPASGHAGAQGRAGRSAARVAGLPEGLDAPMRVHVAGTEDEPVVVATIGDFAADLGENGKFFVRREFVEHFVTKVLELGGPSRDAPMIAFLSQAEGNERECTFKIGEVSGRLSVLVTPRRVIVMCSFAADEKDVRNLASLGGRGPLARASGRAG